MLSVDDNLSGIAGIHSPQHIQDGGFSGAGRTDDDGKFAFADIEGDPVGSRDPDLSDSVRLRDVFPA